LHTELLRWQADCLQGNESQFAITLCRGPVLSSLNLEASAAGVKQDLFDLTRRKILSDHGFTFPL
jgi:hypothetical protein